MMVESFTPSRIGTISSIGVSIGRKGIADTQNRTAMMGTSNSLFIIRPEGGDLPNGR
jgi:hypothetical protein